MTRPRPRFGATLALTTLALAAIPAAASAKPSGATTIELKGAAATALAAQNVRISAQKPATANARRIVLPVIGGTVAGGATLRNGGSVSFRTRVGRRTRTVKLTGWQTQVGSAGSKVSAKLGKRRLTLFTIAAPKRRVALDRSSKTARLSGGSVRLTAAGAKALRTRLALRTLAAGPLGSARVAATLDGATRDTDTGRSPTPTPTPGGPTPSTPMPATPTPRQCSGYSTGDVPTATDPLPRPVGALGVASAPMSWYGRDSWIRYINSGLAPADGFSASDGATLGPLEYYPEGTETFPDPTIGPRLEYSATFTFDPAHSWYAPNGASSTGLLSYTGTVRFLWAGHGIDLTFKNPEIELNSASSRLVFTVSGASCSAFPPKRVEVLKLASAAPAVAAPSYAYGPIAATMARDGGTLFSGQYYLGDQWGSVRGLVVTTQG